MRAKSINNSEKIFYKGTPAWVKEDDLYDLDVEKLYIFKDKELQYPIKNSAGMTVMVKKEDLEDILKETIAGGAGAGYAVWGGGGGRSFGNPSMGASFKGRGFGFGSGAGNLHGGPNLMYTYDVKPLNRTLEPSPSETKETKNIHVGSLIKGKSLGKEEKEDVIGRVIAIDIDSDNNIKWYLIFDPQYGNKKKIDPTSAQIHEPSDNRTVTDEFDVVKDYEDEDEMKESFYPRLKKCR